MKSKARQKIKGSLSGQRGQSLVEMALITPVLLLMFLGVVEVGWALRTQIALQNANREAARFAARGRYLDFSKPTREEIGYGYVVAHELDSLAGQVPLDVSEGSPNGTIIISHLLVDTGYCEPGTSGDPDNDVILTPDTPGYEHFSATYGQPRSSKVDFAALGEQMRQENEAFNCALANRTGGEYVPSINSVVIVETYYEHPQLLGVPVVSNRFTDPILLYSQTTMRITPDSRGSSVSEGQACLVYPIAVHTSTLDGLQPGDSTGDIFNGGGPGNFGWLRWNDDPGSNSQVYLVDELRNPALSLNDFRDASDPSDTYLNGGSVDWVWGLTGVVDSNDVRDELQDLVDNQTPIRIVVWDDVAGAGSNLRYRVARFVIVQLTAFDLPQKWIRAVYVSEDPDACPGNGQ